VSAQPSAFIPRVPGDFIGPAGKLARLLESKANALRASGACCKLLLYGEPGVAKTRLAEMLAGMLAGHSSQVQSINGRSVTVECIRQWQEEAHYRGMNGGYCVRIINEGDTIPPAAQDLLLTYLDELPDWRCVVITCNAGLECLSKRFQSRFQQFMVKLPSAGEIAELLKRFGLNGHADTIAQRCAGNVRSALLDAQSVLDAKAMES
jgi:replication-associated recombination protein RarA